MKRVIRPFLVTICAVAVTAVAGIAATGSEASAATIKVASARAASIAAASKTCANSEAEIRDVPHRLFAAWNSGNGAGIGAVFTTDGHFVTTAGKFLTSQNEISQYYTAALAGPLNGIRVIGTPATIRCLGPTTVVVDGYGGLLLPGETYTDPAQVPLGRRFVVSWVGVQENCVWYMKEFQATTIAA
ncbi:MAG: hypothetical protein JWO79_1936 [Actinomycetia bacterium]|nr:hypothetical protein [Actinomycetes bacterium]MDQ1654292.1 hypothetical protein [Cryptosporangiaceae bacterium]